MPTNPSKTPEGQEEKPNQPNRFGISFGLGRFGSAARIVSVSMGKSQVSYAHPFQNLFHLRRTRETGSLATFRKTFPSRLNSARGQCCRVCRICTDNESDAQIHEDGRTGRTRLVSVGWIPIARREKMRLIAAASSMNRGFLTT